MNAAGMPDRLARLQTAFAAHIRNPAAFPAPADVDDRRMQVYRELFFNNVESLLAGNFPVLRQLYDEPCWHRLVRDFYAEHRARTPLFPELPKEFLRYLQDGRGERPDDPPFLLELAHYEWVEAALALDPRELDAIPADRASDLIACVPVLSPLSWLLSYNFPVHRISPEYRPDQPPAEPTHLLAYRNRADEVRFMQLNELTRLLVHLMGTHPDLSGRELLLLTAEQSGYSDPEGLTRHGRKLLENLRARDIVLGARVRGTTS